MNNKRKGDWIQTFSGIQFWPLDPKVKDIYINDIAHALSNLCRFNGHSKKFYSIAEHSYHVSCFIFPINNMITDYIKYPFLKRLALVGLLHDAAEAYLADIPRPLKPYLKGYGEVENKLSNTIFEWANISPLMQWEQESIKSIDTAILMDEQTQIMNPSIVPWKIKEEPLGITINCWPPELAKEMFLKRYEQLQG